MQCYYDSYTILKRHEAVFILRKVDSGELIRMLSCVADMCSFFKPST